jgi:hypothetical protein
MFSEQFLKELRHAIASVRTSRFSVPISVQLLANMRRSITDKNIPVTHIVCGSDVWPILSSDDTLRALIIPTENIEQVNIGFVATVFALPIICEGALPKLKRFLKPNTLAVAALDTTHKNTWHTKFPELSVLDAVASSISR